MEMRENVLRRVSAVEEKRGVKYAKKSGAAYKRLRILYTVAGIYTLGIHLLFLLGILLMEQFSAFKAEIAAMGICTLLIVAGYVLTFHKWNIVAWVISVIPQAVLTVLFARMLEADVITSNIFRYKPAFYYRHFAPLVIMIIVITVMTVVAVREKRIVRKSYKQVMENLYEAYRETQGDSFTEEAWTAFLNAYDPEKHHEYFGDREKKSENS